jgi:hypothetical protein
MQGRTFRFARTGTGDAPRKVRDEPDGYYFLFFKTCGEGFIEVLKNLKKGVHQLAGAVLKKTQLM